MSGRRRLGRRFHVWQSNINYFYANTQFNSFFISQTQLQSLCKNWDLWRRLWVIGQNWDVRKARTRAFWLRSSESGVLTTPDLGENWFFNVSIFHCLNFLNFFYWKFYTKIIFRRNLRGAVICINHIIWSICAFPLIHIKNLKLSLFSIIENENFISGHIGQLCRCNRIPSSMDCNSFKYRLAFTPRFDRYEIKIPNYQRNNFSCRDSSKKWTDCATWFVTRNEYECYCFPDSSSCRCILSFWTWTLELLAYWRKWKRPWLGSAGVCCCRMPQACSRDSCLVKSIPG